MTAKPATRDSRRGQHREYLWKKASELFGVDLRSLAAFRIGVAIVILLDLWYRGRELTAFFTDNGLLPRVARIELYAFGEPFGFEHTWSLHMLSGTFWSQVLLLLIAAGFAVALLVGYRTRLAAAASWILLMSLDGRNPMILDSGDVLLRGMLMWSLFLPLGACLSVDQRRAGGVTPSSPRVLSVASFALLMQLCMMYWFSAGFKVQPLGAETSPWLDYSAVYYALNCDAFATRFGLWLRQFPELMQLLTVASLAWEVAGPLLAFSPWRTKWLRTGVVFAFILFHAGLGLSLALGLFPVICAVCWLVFLPAEFWDALAKRFPALALRSIPLALDGRVSCANLAPRQGAASCSPWYVQLLALALLLYVVAWNVRELDFKRWEWVLPRRYNAVARALGLDQNWSMFAPKPRTADGWLVMRGTLRDGSEVNLWQFDQPIPWDKPALVNSLYLSQRWLKYLDNLTIDHYAPQRRYFCDWLAWRWNRHQAAGQPDREVHKVELIHRLEITPPPGNPIPQPETRALWTWYYE